MNNNNTQNKIFSMGMAGDTQLSTQNVSFQDANAGMVDTRGSVMDPTRNLGFSGDVPLQDFFRRPVRLTELDWQVDNPLFARLNVWDLFWNNLRNREKIKNYFLLKCTLHVKIVLNGNAFYYGRAIAGYEPLVAQDNTSAATLKRKFSYVNEDLVRLSQRMHVYINPTDSTGGSLELPFFYPKNALLVPSQGWADMGDLVIMSLNDLKHANGGTDPISISVFAWAENVSFDVPTGLAAPEMADEHDQDIISRPASAVARFASSLTNVPFISPFARATEIGASAVASISKIFGYSSPTNLEYMMMVPSPKTSLATVDNKYVTNKLSVDSKQEVTIDPRTTGINPADELPIASIAGRESYLTSFDWIVSMPQDVSIFQVRVDPFLYRTLGSEYHFPACAAAALPFEYWRGTMRFRFQVVSSNYHKGRLRLVYDPFQFNGTPQFNTQYTTIHDISAEKDFTIDIGWAQNEPFRQRADLTYPSFQGGGFLVGNPSGSNGVLGVYVMNQLTTPGTVPADIKINVFVSMLDDFEVAVPNPDITKWSFREPEMYIGEPEMDSGDADCCVEAITDPPTIDKIADTIIDTPDTTKLFFGEVIGSFRQMLKRTVLHEIRRVNELPETTLFRMTRGAFPEYGGFITDGLLQGSMAYEYTDGRKAIICNTTYLNYVARMFAGWRGSIRWTVDTSMLNVSGGTEHYNSVTSQLSRTTSGIRTQQSVSLTDAITENSMIALFNSIYQDSTNGMFLGNTSVNPIQSIEVPFYSNNRFVVTWKDEGLYEFGMPVAPSWCLSTVVPGTEGVNESFLTTYCSAGEDFNLFFFNGMPPIYRQSGFPFDSGV